MLDQTNTIFSFRRDPFLYPVPASIDELSERIHKRLKFILGKNNKFNLLLTRNQNQYELKIVFEIKEEKYNDQFSIFASSFMFNKFKINKKHLIPKVKKYFLNIEDKSEENNIFSISLNANQLMQIIDKLEAIKIKKPEIRINKTNKDKYFNIKNRFITGNAIVKALEYVLLKNNKDNKKKVNEIKDKWDKDHSLVKLLAFLDGHLPGAKTKIRPLHGQVRSALHTVLELNINKIVPGSDQFRQYVLLFILTICTNLEEQDEKTDTAIIKFAIQNIINNLTGNIENDKSFNSEDILEYLLKNNLSSILQDSLKVYKIKLDNYNQDKKELYKKINEFNTCEKNFINKAEKFNKEISSLNFQKADSIKNKDKKIIENLEKMNQLYQAIIDNGGPLLPDKKIENFEDALSALNAANRVFNEKNRQLINQFSLFAEYAIFYETNPIPKKLPDEIAQFLKTNFNIENQSSIEGYLEDLAILPVQHLCRYSLFLKDFSQLLAKDDNVFKQIIEYVDIANQTAQEYQENKENHDNKTVKQVFIEILNNRKLQKDSQSLNLMKDKDTNFKRILTTIKI